MFVKGEIQQLMISNLITRISSTGKIVLLFRHCLWLNLYIFGLISVQKVQNYVFYKISHKSVKVCANQHFQTSSDIYVSSSFNILLVLFLYPRGYSLYDLSSTVKDFMHFMYNGLHNEIFYCVNGP
jgi:hypothetical protein